MEWISRRNDAVPAFREWAKGDQGTQIGFGPFPECLDGAAESLPPGLRSWIMNWIWPHPRMRVKLGGACIPGMGQIDRVNLTTG